MKTVKERLLRAAQKKQPMFDLIFLDYNMPDINGPEVAMEIRRLVIKA